MLIHPGRTSMCDVSCQCHHRHQHELSQSLTINLPSQIKSIENPSQITHNQPPIVNQVNQPLISNHSQLTCQTSHHKSLTITVPRTLLPNKITISDILDDINTWSLSTPPALSQSSEFDPIEFIASYATGPRLFATQPASPAPSLTETTCIEMPVTILNLEDKDENNKIHSRWSCSTVTTLATSSPPSPTFAVASTRHHDHVLSTGLFPSIFGPIKGVARKPIHTDPPPLLSTSQ
jgi:hypothetical protein